MKKIYSFLLTLTALLCLGTGTAWGETLTVADGTQTTSNMPVYGTYVDETPKYHSQFIYPKSLLDDLEGGTISKLEFYSSNASVSWGSAIRFSVKLAEVSETSPSGFLSPTFTTVFSDAALNVSGNKLTVDFNQTNFTYTGANNLLVDVEVTTTGTYSSATFYGITLASSGYMKYSSGSSNQNLLPKVTFTYTAPPCTTCCKPVVTLDDYDDESATFSWTQGNEETQWQYLCLPAATTLTDSHWESATLTDSYSATVTGLTKSTDYIFYIRSYCGVSSQSKAAKVPFTTACMVVKSLPFASDFSTATNYKMPDCWLADGLSTTGYTAPYVVSNSYIQFYGNNNKTYNASRMSVIVLPKFTADIKNLKITIEYSTAGAEDATAYPQFRVGYLKESELSDPTKFHSLATLVKTGGTTTYVTSDPISLSGADSGSRIAICFNNISTTSTSSMTDRYGRLKSVVVESAQDCNTPQNVENTAATGTTATFSWDERPGVPTYQYCVVARDAAADWSGNLTTNTNSCTAIGLTASTNYDFYVKCVCGGGVAGPIQFATGAACAVPSNVQFTNQVWNGATVTWNAGGDETAWNLRYKADSGDWTTVEDLDATSYNMPTLTPGTTYTVQVEADCQAGWSDEATYTPACPALGELSLSNEQYNGVTVSWYAATGISTWTLKYRKGSDDWIVVNDIDALTYTIESGLVTNEEYTIELNSECGNYVSTTYTPEYTAPTSVTVAAQDLGGDASWAPVDGATGYQYIVVLKDAAQDWTSPATGTTVSSGYVHANPVISGLHAKTAYDFYVKAVFAGGSSSATKKSFTTTSHAPNTPAVADGNITSSSAIATWTLPSACQATQCQWICKLTSAGAPAVDDAAWSTPSTEFTANISDLAASTNYTIYVRAYYEDGIYSSNASKGFKTDCGTASLPLAKQAFSSSLPECWVSSYTSNEWGYEYYGTYHSAYYSAQYLANTATSNSADLKTPTISVTDKATLTFWYRNYYYKSSVTYYATGEVLFDDGESETELWSIDHTSSSIVQKSIDLSDFNLVGKTGRFIFRGHGAGTSSYARMWIDDVEITINPISAPTNLAAAPTADGADVTWDAEEGPYDLRYRVNGSSDAWTSVNSIADKNYTIESLTTDVEYEVQVRAHASANRISSWTTSQTFTPVNCPVPTSLGATEVTHNSATISWSGDAKALRYKKGSDDWSNETISPAAESFDLSELVAESTYTVQVKADCEDGDTWSAEFEFTTPCAPITITKVAPYEADFAGLTNEMPACWNKSETTYPYVTSEELKFYANESNQTAILPTFSNDIATLVLKFSYKNYSSLSGYGKLQVGYIDNAGDFQAVGSTLTNKTSYFETEVNFDGVSGAKNIAIRFLDNANAEAYSYVKDVVVELAPTCVVPASIANPTSVTANGAAFTWAVSTKNTETHYQYVCVSAGETPNWSAATKVAKAVAPAENTAELNGLNAHTSYDFYVRSWCSDEDQSEAISKNFETECGIETLPYAEKFNSSTLNSCWTVTGTSSSSYNWRTYTGEASYEGTGRARFTATTSNTNGNTGSLESPSITLSSEAALHFVYMNPKAASLKVYIKEGSEERVELADLSAAKTAWTEKNILLTGYKNKTVKIFFDAVSNHTAASYVDLDEVSVHHALLDTTNNTSVLAGLNGQTVDVTIGRTFTRNYGEDTNPDHYNTICLPFSLSAEELAASPIASDDLWAFKYAKVDEATSELQFRIIEADHIEAGVPYFIGFPANEDNIVNPFFKNVTITASVGQKVGDEAVAQLCGIMKPEPFAVGDQTKLFLYTQTNTLYWWNGASDSQLNGFRAFFKVNTGGGGSHAPIRFRMAARIVKEEQETHEEQVATGMENATLNEYGVQKVMENGHVIILRNGEKYTLQGQKIQ